jgi:hypothetical protein
MRVEQLADLEFTYPTFTAVGVIARRIARSMGLVPLASRENDSSERLRAAE